MSVAATELATVVPLTVETLALQNVHLRDLIEFRKREIKDSTGNYVTLRHNYLSLVELSEKKQFHCACRPCCATPPQASAQAAWCSKE
jgi:hypothetical protein